MMGRFSQGLALSLVVSHESKSLFLGDGGTRAG